MPKNQTFKFTISMIFFYIFSTSLINWINGLALKNPIFYSFIFIIDIFFLEKIVKIIKRPHLVKNKNSKTPIVLITIAVIVCLLLLTNQKGLIDLLNIIYLFFFLTSMAFFIYWYKKTGIEKIEVRRPDSLIFDDFNNIIINQPEEPVNELTQLEDLLKEVINLNSNSSDNNKTLKESYLIVQELIKQKIKAPKNIINQINNILNSYIYLSESAIQTVKVKETLYKVKETFPVILNGLTAIYNKEINQNLNEIEIEAETLKKLLSLSGFN